MKDTLTHNNYEDFRRRYSGTYGFLESEEIPRKFVHLTGADHTAVYFTDNTRQNFHINADAGIFFEFIPVNRGWFKAKDDNLYYLQRVPARQWQRGICPANTQMFQMTAVGPVGVPLSYSRLESVFNCKDNYEISNLMLERKQFALSKQFAVCPSGVLYWYLQPIGNYNQGTLSLEIPEIQQELSDILRRRELRITLETKNG